MFSELKLGDKVQCRGPKGAFKYTKGMCQTFGMIAGGTGITPMLQVSPSEDLTVAGLGELTKAHSRTLDHAAFVE